MITAIRSRSYHARPWQIVLGLVFFGLLAACDSSGPQAASGLEVETGPRDMEISVICLVDRIGATASAETELLDGEELSGGVEPDESAEPETIVSGTNDGVLAGLADQAQGTSLAAIGAGNTLSADFAGNTLAAAPPKEDGLAERGFGPEDMQLVREMMLLEDKEKVWLRGAISEQKTALLMPGLPVVVQRGKNSRESYRGYLTSVSQVSGRHQAEIVVADRRNELQRGEMLNASVTYRRLSNAALLPLEAAVAEGEGNSLTVCLLRDGQALKLVGLAGYPETNDRLVVVGEFAGREVFLLEPDSLDDGRPVIVEYPDAAGAIKHWSEE